MSEIKAVVRQDTRVSVPSVGIQGFGTSQSNIENLKNVDATEVSNGSVLVYKTSTNKWTSTTTLDAQNMEGGHY